MIIKRVFFSLKFGIYYHKQNNWILSRFPSVIKYCSNNIPNNNTNINNDQSNSNTIKIYLKMKKNQILKPHYPRYKISHLFQEETKLKSLIIFSK